MAGFSTSFSDINQGLFGSNVKGSGSGKTTEKGTITSQLELEEEAINKIIADVLGGSGGLAAIFGGEQSSGLYNTSVAAQEAGDLATKLIGELAKLTAKQVETKDVTSTTDSKSRQKSPGLLSNLTGGLL